MSKVLGKWLTANSSDIENASTMPGDTLTDAINNIPASLTGYTLLAGRVGGQTLIGGTASGNSLTLRTTSHATKGYVIIADDGGMTTIGTATPAGPSVGLTVKGPAITTGDIGIYASADGAGGGSYNAGGIFTATTNTAENYGIISSASGASVNIAGKFLVNSASGAANTAITASATGGTVNVGLSASGTEYAIETTGGDVKFHAGGTFTMVYDSATGALAGGRNSTTGTFGNSLAWGYSCSSQGDSSVAFGYGATTAGNDKFGQIAAGWSVSTVNSKGGFAFGAKSTKSSGDYGGVIGYGLNSAHTGSILMGYGGDSDSWKATTTGTYRFELAYGKVVGDGYNDFLVKENCISTFGDTSITGTVLHTPLTTLQSVEIHAGAAHPDTTGATGLDDFSCSSAGTGWTLFVVDSVGATDTVKYSTDGGVTWAGTGIAMTGASQSLNATVKWTATTGHTLGNYWKVSADATAHYISYGDTDATTGLVVGEYITVEGQVAKYHATVIVESLLYTSGYGTFIKLSGYGGLGSYRYGGLDIYTKSQPFAVYNFGDIDCYMAIDKNGLVGIGTGTPTSPIHLTCDCIASAGAAASMLVEGTLTAAANGDKLVNILVDPTYTLGSYTGVGTCGIKVKPSGRIR